VRNHNKIKRVEVKTLHKQEKTKKLQVDNESIDVNARFEIGLLDTCLKSVMGDEGEWRENEEPHPAEMAKARDLTRKYILLLWEKQDRDLNMTCGDIIDKAAAYFNGAMAVLTGEVQLW
jgi:hypothetical protein